MIVIQNNIGNHYSPTTIVMPLSSKVKKIEQAIHTLLKKDDKNGLMVDSVVLGE